ncbi:MAG: hypothetical protein KBD83_08350, partial [Gammaproteobacteria bacterium]|nr:hypothetical protein [Gammaproteobacteria bacterium]
GTKIFPSESVNQFVAAVSQQAKTLGLLKSGLTRTESSLARLLLAIQHIYNTKPYSVSHGGPRDSIISAHATRKCSDKNNAANILSHRPSLA